MQGNCIRRNHNALIPEPIFYTYESVSLQFTTNSDSTPEMTALTGCCTCLINTTAIPKLLGPYLQVHHFINTNFKPPQTDALMGPTDKFRINFTFSKGFITYFYNLQKCNTILRGLSKAGRKTFRMCMMKMLGKGASEPLTLFSSVIGLKKLNIEYFIDSTEQNWL